MMYEENILTTPYFEIEYLDDDNNRHLTHLKDERDVNFIKDRFILITNKKIEIQGE